MALDDHERRPDALTAPARTRRRIATLVVFLVIAGLGAATYYYFWGRADAQTEGAQNAKAKGKGKGKGGPGANRPVPISAAPVQTADVGVYLSGLGTVTPIAT